MLFRLLSGLIDRIFVVAGALLFAQAPQFFHAYTQRLGGHFGELKRQVSAIRQSAETSGKTMEEYIHKFVTHSDPDISLQGEVMDAMLTRFKEISTAYTSMIHATPLNRPFQFLKHFQMDVARMTGSDFQFGLTFTLESVIYALIGMGIGYLLFSFIKGLFQVSHRLVKGNG